MPAFGATGEFAITEGASTEPVDLHKEMLSRISALEVRLEQLSTLQALPGHNVPPEPIEGELSFPEIESEISDAIAVLRSQPPVSIEGQPEVQNAVQQLFISTSRIRNYLAKKSDIFITSAIEGAGGEIGKRIGQTPFWLGLYLVLMEAAEMAKAWLQSLPSPN